MTLRRSTVTVLSMLWLVPALAQAQDAAAPDAPAGASVLQVQDAPDQIIQVNTRIRHTTVIQLPARENILDFVVGDSEYWHLTGAANLAFLKPIGEARQHQRRARLRERADLFVPCDGARRPAASDCPRRSRPGHHDAGRRGRSPPSSRARAWPSISSWRSKAARPCKPRSLTPRRRSPPMRQDADRAGRSVSRDLSHAVAVSL